MVSLLLLLFKTASQALCRATQLQQITVRTLTFCTDMVLLRPFCYMCVCVSCFRSRVITLNLPMALDRMDVRALRLSQPPWVPAQANTGFNLSVRSSLPLADEPKTLEYNEMGFNSIALSLHSCPSIFVRGSQRLGGNNAIGRAKATPSLW